MPLQPPKIDDRTYREILNEALARIRVHNPEWNNFNDSDPGVTLLQLFAFIGESVIYRTNLVPERNRARFLSLLGIPLQPAAAATGLVTFGNRRQPAQTLTLPRDLELTAGKVPFRARDGLDVLPLESAAYYKRRSESADERLQAYWELLSGELGADRTPVFYQTTPLPVPLDPANLPLLDLGSDAVVDHSAWLALLAPKAESVATVRAAIAHKFLNLGLYPAADTDPALILSRPANSAAARELALVFELSSQALTDTGRPQYTRLDPVSTEDVLSRPGVVALRLPGESGLTTWTFDEPLDDGRDDYPPSLVDARDQQRLVCWLRIRMAERERSAGLSARFHWLGVNAAMVGQRTHAAAESLGVANGGPDQSVTLSRTPVIAESVLLTVDRKPWQRVEDLLLAGPEIAVADPRRPATTPTAPVARAEVFSVDRESGEIRFGDGLHGARPAAGASLRASYDYGGGAEGNVNIGAINKGPALPAGIKVSNPLPTWGGAAGESVEQAERNIPRYLQHQDRLVTADDYRDLARRTPGVGIGRVEVLPLYDSVLGETLSPGVVTLLVIPAADPAHPDCPQPDQRMLELVCAHLEPRRLITTELHIRGPRYVSLLVSVGIEIVDGRDFPPIREAVNAALRRFLSPLAGGRAETGWPLRKHVVARELWAEAARVDGVAYVNTLRLGDAEGNEQESIPLVGLQLPQLFKIETRQGDAESLQSLLGIGTGGAGGAGGASGEGDTGGGIVPIPIVPEQC